MSSEGSVVIALFGSTLMIVGIASFNAINNLNLEASRLTANSTDHNNGYVSCIKRAGVSGVDRVAFQLDDDEDRREEILSAFSHEVSQQCDLDTSIYRSELTESLNGRFTMYDLSEYCVGDYKCVDAGLNRMEQEGWIDENEKDTYR